MHDENRLSPILERLTRRAWLGLIWASRGVRALVPEPQMAQIEVTNRCNLTCRTCTRLKLPELGEMSFDDFRRLVDTLGSVRRIWLSGQGEPLLHSGLPSLIRYCAEKGIRDTIVHTNGMLLTGAMAEGIAESGLGELRVSIDGGTAEEMDYLRDGASLRQILENVRSFVERKSTTRTAFYTVLNRRNHSSAPLLPTLAASVGVKRLYMVETVPFRDESTEREIYDRREYQFASLPPETRRSTLADIRREAIRQMVDVRIDLKWYRKRCFEPFQKMYVDFQGNVTPCCRIHNEFFVGNILKDGLEGSWRSKTMDRWRRDILRSRDHRRICVERCNLGIGPDRRSKE
jgi:radical SAM protein with 4Fe4S-binding SPASM domain